MTSRKQRFGRALGETLLSVAALGGLICIVLFVLAITMNISLIMFKTGSMSPTIPAGSVALVREIPAAEIEVGDVVTVDRDGQLPVTHRVTSVTDVGTGAIRTITMKGDANNDEDPAPYTVSTVRIVLGSVPGLANVIVWFSNPLVLGALTVAASLLITWTFWPRASRDGDDVPPGNRTAGRAAGVALSAVTLGGLSVVFAPAQSAVAAPHTEVTESDIITLTSISDPEAMQSMAPGVPAYWQIGIAADAPEPGNIEIGYRADGARELQLNTEFRTCSMKWRDNTCAGTEGASTGPTELEIGGPNRELVTVPADEELWVLVTASVPQGAAGTVTLTMYASGMGDESSVTPGGPITSLPRTGADVGWMLWLALGTLASGFLVSRFAAYRRDRAANREVRDTRRQRLLRTGAVVVVVGLSAAVVTVKPEPTTAAWTDTEHASSAQLHATTLPAVQNLRCTDRATLGGREATVHWDAPTAGLPDDMIYELMLEDLTQDVVVSLYPAAGRTSYRFESSLLEDLTNLGRDGDWRISVYVAHPDPSYRPEWRSAPPNGANQSVIVKARSILLVMNFSCA